MLTFTMRREGQFVTNFSTPNNQCGKAGQQIYRYVCEIEVGEKLDTRGFILDNYSVQNYFEHEYGKVLRDTPAQSCELIAQNAMQFFVNTLQVHGREVRRVSVTIYGSEFAGLTATWTPTEQRAPEAQSDLGVADVWHQGSRSYYRAKLLKKLTPEANFDPTDPSHVQPEELRCDHCQKTVELDGGKVNGDIAAGREDYIHKHGSYVCSGDWSTQATVNGQDYVIKTKVAA